MIFFGLTEILGIEGHAHLLDVVAILDLVGQAVEHVLVEFEQLRCRQRVGEVVVDVAQAQQRLDLLVAVLFEVGVAELECEVVVVDRRGDVAQEAFGVAYVAAAEDVERRVAEFVAELLDLKHVVQRRFMVAAGALADGQDAD